MKFTLIYIVLLQVIIAKVQFHECIHDKIRARNPVILPDHETLRKQRLLVTTNPQPIRITMDFTPLDTLVLNSTIKDRLILLSQIGRDFYMKRLMVKTPYATGINLSLNPNNGQCIDGFYLPATDKSTGIPNSDFHFYVTGENSSETYLAFANFCVFSDNKFRPVVGRLNFNYGHMTDDYDWKLWIDTTLHEMMHALGFNADLFDKFIKEDGSSYDQPVTEIDTIRGFNTTILKLDLLVNQAIKYFNCSTVTGVQMENQGNIGSQLSHFERTIFYDELMTASRIGFSKAFSIFSFTFLEATGWYVVDMRYPDALQFGYQMGCSFISDACSENIVRPPKDLRNQLSYDFCNVDQQLGCTPDYSAKGLCKDAQNFNDNCDMVIWAENQICSDYSDKALTSNSFEQFGWSSKCFQSNLNSSNSVQCYNNQCNENGTLTVFIGGLQILCEYTGQQITLDNFSGKLYCPDLGRFCNNRRIYCPGWCGQNGVCTGGVCTCRFGYAGPNCTEQCDTGLFFNSETSSCESTCKDGYFGNTLNQNCDLCPIKCLTCDQKNCFDCKDQYLLQNGECVSQCSSGYLQNGNKCVICDQTCLTCENTTTSCLTCQPNLYMNVNKCQTDCGSKLTLEYLKQCVDFCPSNTLLHQGVCEICPTNNYLFNGKCQNSCPRGYYKNTTLMQCLTCDQSCASCTGATDHDCVNCILDYYYINSRCYDVCPDGTYPNSTQMICNFCPNQCQICSNSSTCSSCRYPYFLLDTQCIKNCPDKTYPEISNQTCNICNGQCATCTGPSQNECQSCIDGSFPLQLVSGVACYSVCPDGYYQKNNTCQPCDITCLTCIGGSNTECMQCQSSMILFQGRCVQFCPYEGYYFDTTVSTCQFCHSSCISCIGPNENQCITCQPSKFLTKTAINKFYGTCTTVCSANLYPNSFSQQCTFSFNLRIKLLILLISFLIY